MNTTPRPALSVKQVAHQLGVSPGLVYGIVATGELTSIRIGRRVVIRPDDLDTFIAKHTSSPKPPAPQQPEPPIEYRRTSGARRYQ